MHRNLYFVCPTDGLEEIINDTFEQENYYYTSLGNSITFDYDVIQNLNELIETKKIEEISFILSDDNPFLLDAIGKKRFVEISGLNNFYNQIIKQKEHSEELWKTLNKQFLLISYHLNNKIKELKFEISSQVIDQLKINGKIYSKRENSFRDIHSELICLEEFNLN